MFASSIIRTLHKCIGKRLNIGSFFKDPSCVMFTLLEDLPPQTVDILTYGAPEFSAYLALTLSGDSK
jgi:hypothetical protein